MGDAIQVGHEIRIECNDLVKRLEQNAQSKARRAVNIMANAAKEVLAGQRSGRRYKMPHKKTTYQASAPGEPPAVRSGNLRRNWKQTVLATPASDGVTITCRLTSAMPYAGILDPDGGPPARNIAPRPYKERIKEKARPEIEAIYGSLV